jgi:hypothetical protein
VLFLPVRQDYLKGNPDYLTTDPEFLGLNPEFKNSGRLMSTVDALVPTVDMDATSACGAGSRRTRTPLTSSTGSRTKRG